LTNGASAIAPQGTSEFIDPTQETLDQYQKLLDSSNIAETLDEDVLQRMGQKVCEDFEIDEDSREDWKKRNADAIKLATQVVEAKSEPFEGAANIKYPTLSMAAVQFGARAYGQIIKEGQIVQGKVIGADKGGMKASQAQRIGHHMSYQLTEEMEEWEGEMDALLIALPIEGCEFKKTYYSAQLERNVSQWIRPEHLVVNYHAKSLETASRYTHIIYLSPNQIVERVRSGMFLDIKDFDNPPVEDEDRPIDNRDDDAPHTFYEQYRFWDLDDDGYKEPYIVTVHKDSQKVVRIVARFDLDGIHVNPKGQIARIDPVHYITRYLFMPSPDGGIYGMGFGTLLAPINKSINITLNQIHDAGTLSNTQGGFIGKTASLAKHKGGGQVKFKMGEFKSLNYTGDDIRKAILPLPFKGPDVVLFQVLGLLIDAGEKLGNVVDPLVGQSPGANVPATTTLALIEQGLKVFGSTFKRIHRSLKSELRKLYRLNRLYLDNQAYFTIMDEQRAVARTDYNNKTCDVYPVSDPNQVSNIQKLITAQALLELLGQGLNDDEIRRRYLEALQIPDIDKLIPEGGAKPPIDPKIMLELQKLELERDRFELEMFKSQYDVLKVQADAIKSVAQAEAAELGPQIETYKAHLDLIIEGMKAKAQEKQAKKNESSEQGRSS